MANSSEIGAKALGGLVGAQGQHVRPEREAAFRDAIQTQRVLYWPGNLRGSILMTRTESSATHLLIDPRARTLRVGQAQPVTLRAKSFRLLEVLAEAAPEPVDKDTLAAEVWNGRAVSDDSLVQCVGDIRRAIGTTGQEVLQTLPGLGYCLSVPIEGAGNPGPRSPGQGVAVLPFDVHSEDARLGGLAQGLMMDLVHALSCARVFRVVALSGPSAPLPIHRHRVTGTIHKAGDRLRVVALLTEAATGEILWTRRWDRPVAEYFALQDDIVIDIANGLANAWSGRIAQLNTDTNVARETLSLDAYGLFQHGVAQAAQFTAQGLQAAEDAFRAALEVDPEYGEAWACLSIIYALMTTAATSKDLTALIEARLDAARRAYACHPRSPWALVAGAWVAAYDGDLLDARARLGRAVAAAPNNADVLATAAGIAVLNTDSHNEALLWGTRALELNESRPAWYRFPIGYAHLIKGNAARAVEELQKGPQNYPELLAWQTGAAAELGDDALTRQSRAQLLTLCPEWSVGDYLRSEPFGSEETVTRLRQLFAAAGLPD